MKSIEIDQSNAVIGTILSTESTKDTINPLSKEHSQIEFKDITEYLISIGKEDIAEDLINTLELINFKEERENEKIKNKIKLSKREMEVLALICKGLTNTEIADTLFISNRTVDNHRASLLLKTGMKNTAALLTFAFKNNLVNP